MSTLPTRIRAISTWQVTLGIGLLGLGFLIGAQLKSEGPRVRYTSQERQPLVGTALALQSQQEELKTRILDLRDQIRSLEQQGQGSAVLVKDLNQKLEQARIAAGLVPLQGSGLVLRLQDSTRPVAPGANETDYLVSARDVRAVVEELWLAGAEAVAVNNERVTTTTAILDIGTSVLANSAYLAPPYDVAAIGPADLYDRLSKSVGFVEFVRARAEQFGVQVSFAELSDVVIPAYAGSVNLRHARPAVASPGP